MNVLSFSYCFPSNLRPTWGIFVLQRLAALARHVDLEVASPVPFFPLLTRLRHGLPAPIERHGGLTVHYPRWLYLPGILKDCDGRFYASGIRRWFRRTCRNRRPDLLDVHFVWPDGVGVSRLAREAGLPYAITLRGKLPEHVQSPAQRAQCVTAMQGAAAVISVSGQLAEMAADLGVPRERLHVIPNGVNTDRFRPMDRAEARRALGLDPEGRLVVAVAHLKRTKGQDELVEAAASLPGDVRLVLVGKDPGRGAYRRHLEGLIARLGLADRVTLAGRQPHDRIPLYLNAADVSVLASYREGCPNVVLESLACGTPVVATRVGAVPDLVAAGDTGLTVPPRDAGALRTSLREAVERTWSRERIRASVHGKSWAGVAEQVLAVFEGMDVNTHSRPVAEQPEVLSCRDALAGSISDQPTSVRCSAESGRRRVLALVGNTQVGLWVTRSLGRAGLTVYAVCTSARGLPAHSRYVAGAHLIDVPPGGPAWVDRVEALARRLGVGSILTIAEGYHAALIRERDRFEPDIHVFSPPAECFRKATDKDFMHRLCDELGVPVAKGMTLDALLACLADDPLHYPLVLRTRNQNTEEGRTAWKCAYATDREELKRLTEEVSAITSNVIVQQYHPGVEDHVQVLMHEGEAVMVGEYIGEHHFPLAGGVTVQRVTCRHEPVICDAVRLLKAIGWEGVAGVQFHYDSATDKYIFLEINPRFIGGLPTVIMAGFDVPHLLWQSHFEPEKMRPGPYRLGMRTRIMGGDANWMLGMRRGDPLPPGQRRLSRLGAAARFLWNCGPWTRDDVFWWRDPKPFFVDLGQMVRKLKSRNVDLIGNPDDTESPA